MDDAIVDHFLTHLPALKIKKKKIPVWRVRLARSDFHGFKLLRPELRLTPMVVGKPFYDTNMSKITLDIAC